MAIIINTPIKWAKGKMPFNLILLAINTNETKTRPNGNTIYQPLKSRFVRPRLPKSPPYAAQQIGHFGKNAKITRAETLRVLYTIFLIENCIIIKSSITVCKCPQHIYNLILMQVKRLTLLGVYSINNCHDIVPKTFPRQFHSFL